MAVLRNYLATGNTLPNVFLIYRTELGHGSFGKVYNTDRLDLSRWQLHLNELVTKQGIVTRSQLKALKQEAQIFQAVHNQRVTLKLTVDSTGQIHYSMIMKKIPGESLLHFLKSKISAPEKLKALIATLKALKELHDKHNIIHGDFNPNNVLISFDKTTKKYKASIIDFGCSTLRGSKLRPMRGDWFTAERHDTAVTASAHHDLYPIAWSAWRLGKIELKDLGRIIFADKEEQKTFTVDAALTSLKAQLAGLENKQRAARLEDVVAYYRSAKPADSTHFTLPAIIATQTTPPTTQPTTPEGNRITFPNESMAQTFYGSPARIRRVKEISYNILASKSDDGPDAEINLTSSEKSYSVNSNKQRRTISNASSATISSRSQAASSTSPAKFFTIPSPVAPTARQQIQPATSARSSTTNKQPSTLKPLHLLL
jgi:serine/threonine protein kinase